MKRKDTVGKEGQGRFYWAADPPPGTAHTACFSRLLHPSVMRDAKDGKGLHFVILNRSISQRSESGHPVVARTCEGALLCEWVCPPPSSGFFFSLFPWSLAQIDQFLFPTSFRREGLQRAVPSGVASGQEDRSGKHCPSSPAVKLRSRPTSETKQPGRSAVLLLLLLASSWRRRQHRAC